MGIVKLLKTNHKIQTNRCTSDRRLHIRLSVLESLSSECYPDTSETREKRDLLEPDNSGGESSTENYPWVSVFTLVLFYGDNLVTLLLHWQRCIKDILLWCPLLSWRVCWREKKDGRENCKSWNKKLGLTYLSSLWTWPRPSLYFPLHLPFSLVIFLSRVEWVKDDQSCS